MSTRIICHSALALLSCMLLYACNSLPTETKEKITLTPLDKKSDTDTMEVSTSLPLMNQRKESLYKIEDHSSMLEVKSICPDSILAPEYKIIPLETTEECVTWEQESVRKQLADLRAAREDAVGGEEVPTDDYYRIPAIMNDCKTAFDLTWQGDGHWEGYSYVRTATSGSMDAVITFKATLSIARKPKYFLGIKIHRAIMQIEWTLTADYSNTQVVDVMQLDPNKSDRENAAAVNNRISEIARDYPSCTISTEYIKNNPMEQDNSTDTYHLLWSSDRLEIARDVDSRLTRIYADLVCLEKMMHYKLSIIDVLKKAAPYVNDEQGRRRTLLDESFARWMNRAGSRNYKPMEETTE